MDKGTRGELLDRLAGAIESVMTSHPLRVAVDGPPAAGKTTLADELALILRARGREVIRASTESFHLPRAQRYRRGEFSPEANYHDSFDYDTLRRVLLDPLGPDGDRRYQHAVYDFNTAASPAGCAPAAGSWPSPGRRPGPAPRTTGSAAPRPCGGARPTRPPTGPGSPRPAWRSPASSSCRKETAATHCSGRGSSQLIMQDPSGGRCRKGEDHDHNPAAVLAGHARCLRSGYPPGILGRRPAHGPRTLHRSVRAADRDPATECDQAGSTRLPSPPARPPGRRHRLLIRHCRGRHRRRHRRHRPLAGRPRPRTSHGRVLRHPERARTRRRVRRADGADLVRLDHPRTAPQAGGPGVSPGRAQHRRAEAREAPPRPRSASRPCAPLLERATAKPTTAMRSIPERRRNAGCGQRKCCQPPGPACGAPSTVTPAPGRTSPMTRHRGGKATDPGNAATRE